MHCYALLIMLVEDVILGSWGTGELLFVVIVGVLLLFLLFVVYCVWRCVCELSLSFLLFI